MTYINGKDLTEDITIFAEKIFVFKDVINEADRLIPELQNLEDRFRSENLLGKHGNPKKQIGEWSPWPSNDDPTYFYGRQKICQFNFKHSEDPTSGDLIAYDLVSIIQRAAEDLSEKYFNLLNITLKPYLPDTFHIKEYKTGVGMGQHFDLYPDEDNETILSAVFYLNDNYEGGELNFPQHDIKIKPESGSLIFFPSTADFMHESIIIEKGLKYCVPLFFYKNPPVE